jgi:hypothetical protein
MLSDHSIQKIKEHIKNNNNKDKQKFGKVGNFTFEEFQEKLQYQKNKCYICQQEFQYNGGKYCYFFPSIDRINNKLFHTYYNIAISCFFCNVRFFKQISEKKCGLCDGLGHVYEGSIITKSELFKKLRENRSEMHDHIRNLFEKKEDIRTDNTKVEDIKKIDTSSTLLSE